MAPEDEVQMGWRMIVLIDGPRDGNHRGDCFSDCLVDHTTDIYFTNEAVSGRQMDARHGLEYWRVDLDTDDEYGLELTMSQFQKAKKILLRRAKMSRQPKATKV